MRSLCFLSLGLLLAAGCADTAKDYEVNKPVITEPVPHVPVRPENKDADLDANDSDALDATDNNTATPNSAAPGAAATSGAIEDEATSEGAEPIVP